MKIPTCPYPDGCAQGRECCGECHDNLTEIDLGWIWVGRLIVAVCAVIMCALIAGVIFGLIGRGA